MKSFTFTSPRRPARPPQSPNFTSPRYFSQKSPSSPRRSPRRMAMVASKTSNILSVLGMLIFFSFMTNFYTWRGSNNNAKDGYGMDSKMHDAAWDPDPIIRDDGRRNTRLFTTSKRRDRIKENQNNLRKESEGRGEKDNIQNRNRQSEIERKQYHPRTNITSTLPVDDGKKKSTILDQFNEMIKEKEIMKWRKRKDTKYDDLQLQQLRSFRPHPNRQHHTDPWKLSLPTPAESIKLNQLIILDGFDGSFSQKESTNLKDWLFHNSSADNDNLSEDDPELVRRSQTAVWENDDQCVPMSDWQTTVHPSCNSIHEMDISLLLHDSALSLVSSKGYWRSAWKVDMGIAEANGSLKRVDSTRSLPASKQSKQSKTTKAGGGDNDGSDIDKFAVLKSLKYIHEPNAEAFELSKVDAISLDMLTKSPYTINIHGFCGSSSIQEFAGGDLKTLLPTLHPRDKLSMASYLAKGIADIHAVGTNHDRVDANNGTDVIPASLIHNDINMDNVLLGHRSGKMMPIFNDFNIAIFQKMNAQTGEPCKFHGRFANPQWMSPEQQTRPEDDLSTRSLNEKIDVYALGNILFKITVGNSPWKYDYDTKKITEELKEKIARAKLRGAKPRVPPEIRNSTDPSIKAVLTAMNRCYRNDPELRPSSREVADYLQTQLEALNKSSELDNML